MLKNKKGKEILGEPIIFLVVNLFILCALLFFVWRTSTGDAVMEEAYAKSIALTLDHMKPNSTIYITIADDISYRASKNKYKESPITLDLQNGTVKIQVRKTGGYTARFFTKIEPGEIINRGGTYQIKT
jgi:hypothetical protein